MKILIKSEDKSEKILFNPFPSEAKSNRELGTVLWVICLILMGALIVPALSGNAKEVVPFVLIGLMVMAGAFAFVYSRAEGGPNQDFSIDKKSKTVKMGNREFPLDSITYKVVDYVPIARSSKVGDITEISLSQVFAFRCRMDFFIEFKDLIESKTDLKFERG